MPTALSTQKLTHLSTNFLMTFDIFNVYFPRHRKGMNVFPWKSYTMNDPTQCWKRNNKHHFNYIEQIYKALYCLFEITLHRTLRRSWNFSYTRLRPIRLTIWNVSRQTSFLSQIESQNFRHKLCSVDQSSFEFEKKLKYLLIGPNKFLTYNNFYETLFLD